MKYLLLLPLFVCLVACEKENKSPESAELYVRYDDQERILRAEGVFFKTDPKGNSRMMELKSVSLNDQPLEVSTLQGLRYVKDFKTDLPTKMEWQFVDGGDKEGRYNMTMPVLALDSAKLTVADGFTANLKGDFVAADEKLLLLLNNEQGASIQGGISGPLTSNKLQIPAHYLQGLTAGDWQVTLMRSQKRNTTSGNMAVGTSVEHYSKMMNLKAN